MSLPDVVLDGLLTMAWQSSVLFLVVALACRLLRRAAPRLRHALWLLVLARLVVPAVPLGPGSGLDARTSAWMTNPLRMVGSTWEPTGEAIRVARRAADVSVTEPAAVRDLVGVPWVAALQWVWLLGVMALSAVLALQLLRLRRIRRDARPAPALLRFRLDALRARLGLRRDVDLRLTDALAGPVTTGLWRPTVLLPTALASDLDDAELDGVLLHELAHLRHHDLLVHGLATWARIVFCLHPVAWWTFRSIARERELVADEVALEHGRLQPARYGRTLLKVAARASTDRPTTAALAMGADARELAGRLRQLGTPRDTTRRWTLAPVALLLAAFVVQGCLSDDVVEGPPTPSDTTAVAPGRPWPQTAPQQLGLARLDNTSAPVELAQVCGHVFVLPDRETYGFPGECTVDHDALAPLPGFTERLGGAHARRLELRVAADGSLTLQGRPLSLAELRHEVADARAVLTVHADGQVPMARMVPVIEALDGMHGVVTYGGVHLSSPQAEHLRRRLSALELDAHGGDVVIWADRDARWEQHQAALQTLAGLGHARILLGGVDGDGESHVLRHDLPVDVGVLPEIIEEEPVELIEEVMEVEEIPEDPPVDEEVVEEEPIDGR